MTERLDALWLELFGKKISETECSLLLGVCQKVSADSPLLILAALMVRMQYVVLMESPSTPFRTMAQFRRTMEEHRRSVEQITATYRTLDLNLSEWNGILARTEKDIRDLRLMAGASTVREFLLPQGRSDKAKPTGLPLLCLAWFGCFLTAAVGTLVSMLLFG